MSKSPPLLLTRAGLLLFLLSTGACRTIGPFNQVAYEQAVSLKVETLSLMEKATEPFDTHQAEVSSLLLAIDKAYEYAKGRPDNDFSTQQWEILRDPTKHLVGHFFQLWKAKGRLSAPFIDEERKLASDAFDTIITLESGKEHR